MLGCLRETIPTLTRSALHRCLLRHGISRLSDNGEKASKRGRFAETKIGSVHIDSCEFRHAEGRLVMFLAIDRVSKFTHVEFHEKAGKMNGAASRVAFSKIMPDEKKESAVAFLEAALAYYASLGVSVSRVMTDNGSCYKSHTFRKACADHGLKHVRTRPYTPKTNGKAERFIQTALREWAYAQAYETSDHRADELPRWLHRYNWHRPHGSLKAQTPISRLCLNGDNVLRLHI